MKLSLSIISVAILFSGCATAYAPMSSRGGYRDLPIDVDKYYVMVSGNGKTSKQRVFDIGIRRGAELCKDAPDHNYTKIRILDNKENTDHEFASIPIASRSYSSGNFYSNNGYGTYNGYSTKVNYVPVDIATHNRNYYFQCFEEDGEGFSIEKILKDTAYLIQ